VTSSKLGGRYQLEEPIGGGGMALVYRATDTMLGRTVAVKMLRSEYAGDDEFVSRFRQEAQSAASLSHPNIVSLYDVGVTSENEYYIVMEYVDGPTLKDVIRDHGPLPVEEVIRITKQICDALEHAHEYHIVHRDVKPHNILVNKNGMVKVTDFGIARAITGNTITHQQPSSVLGSVHYFSPEQARGGTTDLKSDIYSLGVVMYEMLTKKLPFSGDTPVSVALKHLRDHFIEPRALNKTIPQSVENIVLKCMVKSTDGRYANMSAVKVDLNDALKHPNVPKFVMPQDVTGETISIPALGSMSGYAGAVDSRSRNNEKNRPWWRPFMWTGIALAVLCLGVFAAYYIVMDLLQVPNLNLPNVVGMTEAQALNALKTAGFSSSQIHEEKTTNAKQKGTVYEQDPEGPMPVKENRGITIYVSLGAAQISMPNVTGIPVAEAIQTLINQGFQKGNITQAQVASTQVQQGDVVSTNPTAGSNVSADQKITLSVSQSATTTVPNIVGLTYDEAVAALQAANLQKGQVIRAQFPGTDGQVFKIAPYQGGDTVPEQTPIDLYVIDNSGESGGSSGGQNTSGLPPNTHVRPVSITVNDASGKTIAVRVLITDARGSNQVVVDQTITSTTTWTENVFVAPGTTGQVQVEENGKVTQTNPVNY